MTLPSQSMLAPTALIARTVLATPVTAPTLSFSGGAQRGASEAAVNLLTLSCYSRTEPPPFPWKYCHLVTRSYRQSTRPGALATPSNRWHCDAFRYMTVGPPAYPLTYSPPHALAALSFTRWHCDVFKCMIVEPPAYPLTHSLALRCIQVHDRGATADPLPHSPPHPSLVGAAMHTGT